MDRLKQYKNLLFDLDGTVVDSKKGIISTFKKTLEYFNIDVKDEKELDRFIGPPLWKIFSESYNFDEEKTKQAVDKYREYFREKGVFENTLYDGIPELLEELYKQNKKNFIATSKLEEFAKLILDKHNLSKYFTGIYGMPSESLKIKKEDIINHIIKENNLKLEETVMIGDREHDIIGAEEGHIDSIGVLYGYGNYKELSDAGATYIFKDVKELKEKLL